VIYHSSGTGEIALDQTTDRALNAEVEKILEDINLGQRILVKMGAKTDWLDRDEGLTLSGGPDQYLLVFLHVASYAQLQP
jgi:hypothetical protein